VEKKERKEKSEEYANMEVEKGAEGSLEQEKPIKWKQLRYGRPTGAVIGEILRAQKTIELISEMDRKNKWWRSTTESKVAREVIRPAGNTIKYGMTKSDEGRGADGWRRLERLMKGSSITEQILVMKA